MLCSISLLSSISLLGIHSDIDTRIWVSKVQVGCFHQLVQVQVVTTRSRNLIFAQL